MILSDRTIREELASGRIVIDPLDESCIQPSSVDMHLDRFFRVFLNHHARVIDVKERNDDLTQLVEIEPEKAFILHPGEFVLGSTEESVGVPDDLVGRLEGKALAIDTPIPTTRGWLPMGDLKVGEEVFDAVGDPTPIVNATEVMNDRPCKEVVFSDRSSFICDESHLWWVVSKADRRQKTRKYVYKPTSRVLDTKTIAESVRIRRNEYNYQVPLCGPVAYETKELPIDPYVLGIWLGDGTSSCAQITTADEAVLEEIRNAGYRVTKASGPLAYRIGKSEVGHRDAVTGRFNSDGTFQGILRDCNLLNNKHIPDVYLQADIKQRTALLQGLMDSDGYVDRMGRCDFTSIYEHLADAFVELAASLGLRPKKAKKTARLNGIDCGPAYEVQFVPHFSVFRLTRKNVRRGDTYRQGSRSIVEVRDVPSVPVRCIEVASPNGVFLAGKTFVPTHNSSLGRLGLLIHSTAGFVDAGFQGHLTLELSNVATLPITLYPTMKIGQISFLRMTTPADVPYGSSLLGSKYNGQRGPTAGRYYENFLDEVELP